MTWRRPSGFDVEHIPAAEINDYLRKHVPRRQWRAVEDAVRWLDQRFVRHVRADRDAKRGDIGTRKKR